MTAISGYRFLIWGYVASALLLAVLFALLSPAVEATKKSKPTAAKVGLQKSRGIVAKLAGLFALDAFAGGFIVQSIVAYWFYLRYKTDLNALGGIFFGTNIFAALSFLAAPAMARRFGLLNTMVFTHLPSNFLILLVPLMPNVEWADGGVTAALFALADGRADAAILHDGRRRCRRTRRGGWCALRRAQCRRRGGAVIHRRDSRGAALGLPFLLAGGIKIVYDLWIFAVFRHVKPPEELD